MWEKERGRRDPRRGSYFGNDATWNAFVHPRLQEEWKTPTPRDPPLPMAPWVKISSTRSASPRKRLAQCTRSSDGEQSEVETELKRGGSHSADFEASKARPLVFGLTFVRPSYLLWKGSNRPTSPTSSPLSQAKRRRNSTSTSMPFATTPSSL